MSLHHPTSELLEKFAAADLDGSLACVIAAHTQYCAACQKTVRALEQQLASVAFEAPGAPLLTLDTSDAWQKLAARMAPAKSPESHPIPSREIQVDSITFKLPRSLHNLTAKPIKWMPFGKGGRISKLGNENGNSLFLIYLAPDEEVPLHSHVGAEHSCVIAGSYAADGMQFETGDFSYSAETVTHAPKAGSEDGCLLLSRVETRLNFLQGWWKPFNALLWFILNMRVKLLELRS